jgi:hypothetical protein
MKTLELAIAPGAIAEILSISPVGSGLVVVVPSVSTTDLKHRARRKQPKVYPFFAVTFLACIAVASEQ